MIESDNFVVSRFDIFTAIFCFAKI